jgi:UDP-N-acetylmuramoyl-L-alanyl-D-glutamate--2,6-diaminopimelate ligase
MMAAQSHQHSLQLHELLGADVPLASSHARIAVSAVTQDSRLVEAGSLFIARAGDRMHGLDYAAPAVHAGCVAIVTETGCGWDVARIEALAESLTVPCLLLPDLTEQASWIAARFWQHPSAQMDVIGVTGTNGKTSCAWLLAQALQHEHCSAMIGTIGIGMPGHLRAATHTTPDAVTLQAELAQLHAQQCRSVAMEVSSHALVQGRVSAVHFRIAAFTNLSQDHLDYHQTMAQYGAAKARLFMMPGLQTAVINVDDPFAERLLSVLDPAVALMPVSTHADARACATGLHLTDIHSHAEGMRCQLHYAGATAVLHTQLSGRFNADNLAVAAAVLLAMGCSLAQTVRLLAQVPPVPGRMQLLPQAHGAAVVVDYAHTPDALEKILRAAREHCTGRLWCVFGCGGDRDATKRPLMGAVAECEADQVILTSDNPRSEEPLAIIQEIQTGMRKPDQALLEIDREAAIRLALQQADANDLIVIAGKGHESYQIIQDQCLPFNDADMVARIRAEAAT